IAASAIPGAQWISDNANGATLGSTVLYAISFNIPVAFSSASFNISYAVDNKLGIVQAPLYLNGTALGLATNAGGLSFTSTYNQAGVQGLLTTGTNWLYIDAANTVGPAGLLFAATITTVDGVGGVPEPGTLLTLGCGLVAIGAIRRYRNVRS
ncbi:MAG: PEP-CTERM sorting domain-containing protein, partial [Bryobacteraceae bacterium]